MSPAYIVDFTTRHTDMVVAEDPQAARELVRQKHNDRPASARATLGELPSRIRHARGTDNVQRTLWEAS